MSRSAPGMAGAAVDELVRRAPVRELRPFLASYGGYRQAGVPPAVHRGLPSPYLTVILTLDDPLEMAAHPDPAQPGGSFDALIGGLHTRPALISHPGRQSGIQVNVHPLGARCLLGLPAGELASTDVPADAVWGPDVARLRARLLEAPTWAERFDVLDRVFIARLANNRTGVAPEVREAWRYLRASGGQLPVAALAEAIGWSSRHLANRFRAEVGLTPKAAARVVRFDRARRRIAAGGDLSTVATAGGYFDHAHLTREFRDLAGCSPTTWLAEEFRNVQDAGDPQGQSDGHD